MTEIIKHSKHVLDIIYLFYLSFKICFAISLNFFFLNWFPKRLCVIWFTHFLDLHLSGWKLSCCWWQIWFIDLVFSDLVFCFEYNNFKCKFISILDSSSACWMRIMFHFFFILCFYVGEGFDHHAGARRRSFSARWSMEVFSETSIDGRNCRKFVSQLASTAGERFRMFE